MSVNKKKKQKKTGVGLGTGVNDLKKKNKGVERSGKNYL